MDCMKEMFLLAVLATCMMAAVFSLLAGHGALLAFGVFVTTLCGIATAALLFGDLPLRH
nr:MAG TPA: hypothetical protein [Caudoviricetes sp.]